MNKETLLVKSWMDEEGDYWIEKVKNYRNTKELAEEIKNVAENRLSNSLGNSRLLNICLSALVKVNWQELADDILPRRNFTGE